MIYTVKSVVFLTPNVFSGQAGPRLAGKAYNAPKIKLRYNEDRVLISIFFD